MFVPTLTDYQIQTSHAVVDAAGNVYIADLFNGRIRRITPDGIIASVANTPSASDRAAGRG